MRRRRKRAAAPVTVIDWTPYWDGVFESVPPGYEPPRTLQLHRAQRHTTVIARFRDPTGHVARIRIRIIREGDKFFATDEFVSMGLRLTSKSKPENDHAQDA